jgi:hypothetical protein
MKLSTIFAFIFTLLFSSLAIAEVGLGDILVIVSSVDKPKLIAFCLAALAGVIAHIIVAIYFTKTITITAGSNLLKFIGAYLFSDKIGSSLAMLAGIIGMGGAYLMGAGAGATIISILVAGATAGYTSDSMFNRSSNLVTTLPSA